MTDLAMHSLVAKYEGEFGTASTIFDSGAGTESTVTITIPNKTAAYILETGGYANSQDVIVEYRNRAGALLYDWEEFPDRRTY